MAIEGGNFIYDYAREGYLDKTASWLTDTIIALATDSTYVPSQSTNRYKNEISAGSIVATSAAMTGKTALLGVAKAADFTFATTVASKTINGIVLVDTTIDAGNTGRLICYIGKDYLGSVLSILTDGSAVGIRFGGGTTKVFRL